jgi:hypothetical protein
MRESYKTGLWLAAAAALVVVAALVEPEGATPEILSDQGEAFYPKFTDPQAPRSIEVIDYDEATATARPLKVQFERGRWLITSHHNYPVDAGERMAKTAAALIDLKKDLVRSDNPADHAQFGVVDPLDQKVSGLSGRGKRVTLRDAKGEVLADYIFGKAVEGKPGQRFVRVPGSKRTYAVKTDADPSARFADWVDASLLRISSGSIRKVTINSYSIDESLGRLTNVETLVLTQEKGEWKLEGATKFNLAPVKAMAGVLDGLKVVGASPKPAGLAEDLKQGQVRLSLEVSMALRQKGYFLAPNGRLYANEGEMTVETADGLVYVLRFGEVATGAAGETKPGAKGENRYLFATVNFDAARAAKYGGDPAAGQRRAGELNRRFSDWFYIISDADFQKLRLRRKAL